jgi:SAM-dependent methyltransferase
VSSSRQRVVQPRLERDAPDPETLAERDRREAEATTLAFGVLPSDRRFRLSRARFAVMADALAAQAQRAGRRLRVLDAGVGQAKLERVYAHRHGSTPLDWCGTDVLGFRLRLRPQVEFARTQADLHALPFAEGSFDAVTCSYVYQHLVEPGAVTAELCRVLRPGGRLLLALPNRPQPLKLLGELFNPWLVARQRRRGRVFSYGAQVQYYNLPRVRRLARAAGLTPVRWQGLGFLTGGPLAWLEDYEAYYRLNLTLGAWFPRLTKDLVCIAEKD